MNLKTENIIIAVLAIALAYYVYQHQSFVSDVSPLLDHPEVKNIAKTHWGCTGCSGKSNGTSCHCRQGLCSSGTCLT